jgi:hypothetical protein
MPVQMNPLIRLMEKESASRDMQKEAPAKAVPVTRGPSRGDDLLKGHGAVSMEDDLAAKEYERAVGILEARVETDPVFANTVIPKMMQLKGDANKQFVLDSADKIEIEGLRKSDPAFSAPTAFLSSGINGALFGQLSRIKGTANYVMDALTGEEAPDWQKSVTEAARRVRLLEKAYPGTSVAGEVASYMIPGAPAKVLFTKAAGLTGKAVLSALAKGGVKSALAKRVAVGAASLGAGAGAVQAVESGLGRDFDFDIDNVGEAAKDAAVAGGSAAIFGASFPLLGAVASRSKATIDKTIEQLSNVKLDTIRASGRFGPQIRAQAGEETSIGKELADIVLQGRNSKLEEVIQAKGLLDSFPKVDASKMVSLLKEVKKASNPRLDSQVRLLNEWGVRAEKELGDVTKADPQKLRSFLDDVGAEVSARFGDVDAQFIHKQLARAYGAGNASIRTTASGQGEVGQRYLDLMNLASQKRSVLRFIGKSLGSTEETAYNRANGFIERVVGKNQSIGMAKLKQLDGLYGTNLAEKAQLAGYARELGMTKGGVEGLISQHRTGKSLLASGVGSTVGGAVGAMVGSAVGSPMVGSAVGSGVGFAAGTALGGTRGARLLLGSSDKISGFIQREVERQEVLSGVASGKFDPRVKEAAGLLLKDLKQHGPRTMSGTMRILADTPIFLGVVSAFEMAERASRNSSKKLTP